MKKSLSLLSVVIAVLIFSSWISGDENFYTKGKLISGKASIPDTSLSGNTKQKDTTGMNNEKMGKIFEDICDSVGGVKGNWQVIYGRRYLFIITDQTQNRMRIITPVIKEKKLSKKVIKTIMEANFDRALDAKYALYNGYLWSVFMHPLKELTSDQFKDAMKQVVVLANNFGISYASSDLIFGGGKK